MGDLILVADSHLVADDPHTAAFLRFLRVEGRTAGTLILVGDIFDLWIAQEGMELPFHRVVVEAIDELRQAGVTVKYVEGNRDYFVGERYARSLFAEVAGECLEEHHAGHRIHVAHGDLVNVDDKQYRLWRRTSRSRPFLTAFRMLPVSLRARLAAYLERKMRRTNLRYRIGFPAEQAETYARQAFEQGRTPSCWDIFTRRGGWCSTPGTGAPSNSSLCCPAGGRTGATYASTIPAEPDSWSSTASGL